MMMVGALDANPQIRSVLALHETVCSGAADGYNRMRGTPAAATLLHLGPGLANAAANLHNARRASTPLVNVIGAMSTWIQGDDPVLHYDIEALAWTFSRAVLVAQEPGSFPAVLRAAMHAAAAPPDGPGASRVVTVVVPHNRTWEPESMSTLRTLELADAPASLAPVPSGEQLEELKAEVEAFATGCAAAIRDSAPGEVAVFLGGAALADPECIELAARVAKAVGGELMCQNAWARAERGGGLPCPVRTPYFPQDALRDLNKSKQVILIDARRPVPMFGYRDLLDKCQLIDPIPSYGSLFRQGDEAIWEVDQGPSGLASRLFLRQLVDKLPDARYLDVEEPLSRPPLPPAAERLNPARLCEIVAALQPEGTILVDEALTSGGPYFDLSRGCPRFSHLCLTGGAIGSGPCLALGAALACPDRVVINLQGEGSFMYSPQALWTQAKERARVVTVICNNQNYQILKIELAKQGVQTAASLNLGRYEGPGGTQGQMPPSKSLTTLGSIDFVALAESMGVRASRASTCGAFADQLRAALEAEGPVLIECML